MIKDSNRKPVIIRKAQEPTENHHHPHIRAASWHHNHHHHPHHRLHHHQQHQDQHLHQLQHLHNNIHERHHQQRRQHNHPRHPHHLIGHDLVEHRADLVPQQPHSHQRHHLRLQNNSQYPVHLHHHAPDHRDTGQSAHSQNNNNSNNNVVSELCPQQPQLQDLTKDQPITQSAKNDSSSKSHLPGPATNHHFPGPATNHHQRGIVDFQNGSVLREKFLPPHCRNLVKAVIRARSVTPPAVRDIPTLSTSENHDIGSEIGKKRFIEKSVLRNAFSLPITGSSNRSISGSEIDTTANVNTTSNGKENETTIGNPGTHSIVTNLSINRSSNYLSSTAAIKKDCNSNTTSPTAPTASSTQAMHLPLHTSLPDGSPVTLDAATERQISDMYFLIQAAAMLGQGYGVDEYPTEDDFRQEIKGGHTFVVMRRGEELENDDLDEEEDEDDEGDGEEREEGIERRENASTSGHLIAAFSLATSKFYRGNDVKVADPIIIVRREERGKGIGEFVFRHAVQFSRRLGFAGVYTDTFSNNTAMMRIIERSPGFKLVGFLPLGGKMPDGTIVGANIYFKDLRCNGEGSGSTR
ncbi:hypothetical protein ElyMa_006684300 [Elysia marginata]|uniref:N-acetyltransferase domain-containing protein n=1 Tax=Elysia marginata TaxID=1093978 RepID=A0AAV4IP29_9GAST|nr:hypothetical protein ElyMa_006684300 [Elysia marginata]